MKKFKSFRKKRSMCEECQNDTPRLAEAKDKGEYDYEGDMARTQLRSIIHNAQILHDMLAADTNLPEWVQNKITLAEDYIVTAAQYLRSEDSE